MLQLRRFFFVAVATATTPALAAAPKESGPWDLMLVTPTSQAIAAASLTRVRCEEGLRLAVNSGHQATCLRYIDNVKAPRSADQRYSAFIYPVSSPSECAVLKRMRDVQIDCLYR